MKRIVLASCLLLGFSALAHAQNLQREPQSPEERAEKITERLAVDLQLSPEQKEAVYQINLDIARQKDAHRERTQAKHSGIHAGYREIEAQRDEQMKSVLDEQQYADYIQKKELMRKRMQKRGRFGRGR